MNNSRTLLSRQGRQAVLSVCYEYLVIIVPIAIYVFLEKKAYHNDELNFYWKSPEWAIATIFLSFQSLLLYRQTMNEAGRKISEVWFGVFWLIAVLLTVIASINAYMSMIDDSIGAAIFRLALFGVVSVAFFLLIGGAKLIQKRAKQGENG